MDERTEGQKAAKAAFLAELKEQAQREGWARRTYPPEDRTYEARRYDDGVLCRRVDELKVGDRARYSRRTNGQTVEGTVYAVTTMPEGTEDASKLAYRLALSREDVEAIGHPVVVPHSRVELVWPESAIAATGFVLLHEGRRLGWKVLRGPVPAWHPDFRYYGTGPEAPSPTLCTVERQPFATWDDAVTWCASFPAHPAETGRPPALDDLQPERGPDDEPVWRTVTTDRAAPVAVASARSAATVLGGNLPDKASENRRRVKVGARVTVTAAVAPAERSGVVVEVDKQRGGVRVLHDDQTTGSRGFCWTWAEISIDPTPNALDATDVTNDNDAPKGEE